MRERIAFAVVFASILITSVPAFVKLFREPPAKRIVVAVPGSEPVALVTKKEKDPALFVAYDLYPRRTKIYAGLAAYRNADPRTRPATIVACDYDSARVTTFAALREEEILSSPRVMHGALEPAPFGTFFVPFVASLEGGVTDRYVTEADFDAPTRMTLMPFGITKNVPARSFHDLVYEVFGRTDAGWLRVEADRPLDAAVWLVNGGRNEGVRVPIVTSANGGTLRCPDCTLRLVNFSDRPSIANVNGASVSVPPNGVVAQPMHGEARVSGENIYPFASTNKMEIVWP